ncbi:Programmed cell death toxin YdcE [hydrothermal vent metagenome]|uniref:Programmed cell death toxin YdcE n=1 Tax=hydrothermal vent metagenome TaxID=652676 RepID=A0A3B0TT82_9ZZZZ
MKNNFPRRGEVWLINFDSSVGAEIKKTRPSVIVSNDSSNKFVERVQVVPITSNTKNIYPCETLVSIKKKEGKVMADQIMTVSKKRVYKKVGMLTEIEMIDVERILKLQLGFRY